MTVATDPRPTSTDYRAPHRPTVVRLANAVGGGLGWRSSLQPEDLMAAARKREGLDDFGTPDVVEPLRRLIDSVEAEADLHPVGRYFTRERLIGVLQNRLRLAAHLDRQPDVRTRTPTPWLVITGMQRTGTTFLQRLMAGDPSTRSLASWEALAPTPPVGADKRRQAAARAQRALSFLAPDFFAVHPVEADGVEEDSLLLDLSFYSPVAEATLRVPSYAKWLEEQDMTAAYTLLREVLNVLESSRRWVLKSPAHMPFLDVLKKAGEDVRVVMTHRDPAKTLASYCSMIAHGRGVFSDAIDPQAIGREYLERQSHMVHRALELRAEDPSLPVLDVHYDDIVGDPAGDGGAHLRLRRVGVRCVGIRRRFEGRLEPYAAPLRATSLSARRLRSQLGDRPRSIRQVLRAPRDRHTGHKSRGRVMTGGDRRTDAEEYRTAVGATLAGIRDQLFRSREIGPLGDDVRLDGHHVLVTGGTTGLGRAMATQLADRGATVLVTGRDPRGLTSLDDAALASGEVRFVSADLSDLSAVRAFVELCSSRRLHFDRVVQNAAMVAQRSRATQDGFDEMEQVNLLGPAALLSGLWQTGAIRGFDGARPRIIVVGSESHRSADWTEDDRLGQPRSYTASTSVGEYGRSKLLIMMFAASLRRRLAEQVDVFMLCPGAVNSDIVREAPKVAKPLLWAVANLMFQSPLKAAEPAVYLACVPDGVESSGCYLHILRKRLPSDRVIDAALGDRLWQQLFTLLAPHGFEPPSLNTP